MCCALLCKMSQNKCWVFFRVKVTVRFNFRLKMSPQMMHFFGLTSLFFKQYEYGNNVLWPHLSDPLLFPHPNALYLSVSHFSSQGVTWYQWSVNYPLYLFLCTVVYMSKMNMKCSLPTFPVWCMVHWVRLRLHCLL